MELFAKLYSSLLIFVYHCFDRIVIHGYLSGLSRPEQVVYFFHEVLGMPVVDKEVLRQRTNDYQNWVEAYARNHNIPIQWAEKGVRKEDQVLPALHRMEKANAYGVYFIFKSMEQGRTFRISVPKYPTQDPNYRILAHQRSRFTHYYFYIRDEVLGPIIVRVASFFPFHATYWLNGHSFIEQELKRKPDRLPQKRQRLPGRGRCGGSAGGRRPAEPGDHPQTTRLLDPDPGTEVLQEGTQPDEPVALLRHRADRVLPQLHFQTPLPHPQNLRAKLRNRPLAADGQPHQRDLRRPAQQKAARQTGHGHRSDRAWPSRLPRLLEERLPQTVREVLPLPAQRTLLQQPARLRPEERTRSSRRRAQKIPDHH